MIDGQDGTSLVSANESSCSESNNSISDLSFKYTFRIIMILGVAWNQS